MYYWVDEFINGLMFWEGPVLTWKKAHADIHICLYITYSLGPFAQKDKQTPLW